MENTTVRKFGQDNGLIHNIIITGRKVGATDEFFAKLARDEALFRQVIEFVMEGGTTKGVAARPPKADRQIGLIETLIKEGGYKTCNSWITDEHAPDYTQSESESEVVFLDLGYCESTTVAIQRMKERGYRPAENPEVLRHCNKHDELPIPSNRIVVLGSVWYGPDGQPLVMILSREGALRRVCLHWCLDWGYFYRFAAMKLSS